jgi:hypothetical protein
MNSPRAASRLILLMLGLPPAHLVLVLPTPPPAGVPDTGLLYMQLAVSLAAAFHIYRVITIIIL